MVFMKLTLAIIFVLHLLSIDCPTTAANGNLGILTVEKSVASVRIGAHDVFGSVPDFKPIWNDENNGKVTKVQDALADYGIHVADLADKGYGAFQNLLNSNCNEKQQDGACETFTLDSDTKKFNCTNCNGDKFLNRLPSPPPPPSPAVPLSAPPPSLAADTSPRTPTQSTSTAVAPLISLFQLTCGVFVIILDYYR